MPNPIITDRFRCQAVFQGLTDDPGDAFVNTWGFRNTGVASLTLMADAIQARMADFYGAVVTQTGKSVGSYISSALVRPSATLKIYDLGQAPPRQVIERVIPVQLGGTLPLPTECAVTASFYGSRNLPRQRGRVYIGPLSIGSIVVRANKATIADDLRITLAHAMRRMTQNGNTNQAEWHVISSAGATSHQVTHGWVDDAFDTQRRRGQEATRRTEWSSTGVTDPTLQP